MTNQHQSLAAHLLVLETSRIQLPRAAKQSAKKDIEKLKERNAFADDVFESNSGADPTPTDRHNHKDPPADRLRVCWDIGTTFISVSYIKTAKAHQAPTKRERSLFSEIEKVDFLRDGKTFWISTDCAYWKPPDRRKAKLYLGEDVINDLLVRQHIKDEDVLRLWKLGLGIVGQASDPNSAEDEKPDLSIREQVQRTLERMTKAELFNSNDPGPITDIDLIGDVVENVWSRAYEQICESGTLAPVVSDPLVDFVICVPSIWTVVENQKMLTGFMDGISRGPNGLQMKILTFELCHEPTAAMGYIFSKEHNQVYETGDTVVIVDMGGGSVDLTTVTIERKFPPILRQEVTGSGDYCGSVMLNETFRKRVSRQLELLKQRLGFSAGLQIQKMVRRLMSGFERTKKSFNDEKPEYLVHCEGLKAVSSQLLASEGYRIIDDGVYVTRSEMIRIFNPTVERIKTLIRDQLKAYAEKAHGHIPNAIVLLGCFSENGFVLRHIREEFGSRLRVERASGEKFCMVSNGGIIASGHKGFIRERRALISYGFSQDIDWDPDVHSERLASLGPNGETSDECFHAVLSPYDNKPMLKNRIKWAVRRNEALPQNYRHRLLGRRFLPMDKNIVHLKEDLFMSRVESQDDLPIHGNNDIMKIASLEMSIKEPRRYCYSTGARRNSDKSSRHDWEVDYFINTYLDGWILTWEVEIPPEGNVENEDIAETANSGWFRSGKQTFNIAAAFTPGCG